MLLYSEVSMTTNEETAISCTSTTYTFQPSTVVNVIFKLLAIYGLILPHQEGLRIDRYNTYVTEGTIVVKFKDALSKGFRHTLRYLRLRSIVYNFSTKSWSRSTIYVSRKRFENSHISTEWRWRDEVAKSYLSSERIMQHWQNKYTRFTGSSP